MPSAYWHLYGAAVISTLTVSRLAAVKSTSTLWLHGYWSYDWADNYVKVTELDNATSTVTMDPKTSPIDGESFYCAS